MKYESSYNFAPASTFDDILFGSERPGYYHRGKIPSEEVQKWILFMKNQNIKEVICLLDETQLRQYKNPLLDQYKKNFKQAHSIPIEDFTIPSARTLEKILDCIFAGEEKNHKILVHCSAGMGRTGIVLAAWLIAKYHFQAQQAVERVCQPPYDFLAFRAPLEAGDEVLVRLSQVRKRT